MFKILLYIFVFSVIYYYLFYDCEKFTNEVTGNTNFTSNTDLINKISDITNNNSDIRLLFDNSYNIKNILITRQSNLINDQNKLLQNIFTNDEINIYDDRLEDKIYNILKDDKETEEVSVMIAADNIRYTLSQEMYYTNKINKLSQFIGNNKTDFLSALKKENKVLYLWLLIQFTTINVDKWKEFVQFYSWLNFTSSPEYKSVFTIDVQNELINTIKSKEYKSKQLENDDMYESDLIILHLNKLWNIKFEQLKEYVKEFKEYPPVKSELGKWYQEQLDDFDNPKKFMTNITIYNKWYNFINDIPDTIKLKERKNELEKPTVNKQPTKPVKNI
jgi:hypothetical protein